VGGFAASSTGAEKKSYALGECVSRGEKWGIVDEWFFF
jgi:hypothetical protein